MAQSLTGKKCLVVGGAGNLGSHVVQQLRQRQALVTSFDVVDCHPSAEGVTSIKGDVCDRDAVAAAMRGHSIVFHCANVIDIRPVPSPNMRRINVEGTKNVVECCKAVGVEVLIYTSSMEVCSGYTGNSRELPDFLDADETVPIPDYHCLPYAASKAAAEACVLAANSDKLKACALRPGYIVGPGCIGMKIEMRNAIGRADCYVTARLPAKMNMVCVHNCAIAHVLAAERAHKPGVGGSSFFISDFQGNVADVAIAAFEGSGIRPVVLPLWVALLMANLLHFAYAFVHRCCAAVGRTYEIPADAVDVKAMSLAFRNLCFSTKKARELLDFDPRGPGMRSEAETAEQTKKWSNAFYAELKSGRNGKAKAT